MSVLALVPDDSANSASATRGELQHHNTTTSRGKVHFLYGSNELGEFGAVLDDKAAHVCHGQSQLRCKEALDGVDNQPVGLDQVEGAGQEFKATSGQNIRLRLQWTCTRTPHMSGPRQRE